VPTGHITRPSTECLLCGIPHNRHSFAVHTLIRWHKRGLDVDEHIGTLSSYLGHVSPADTYWYLSAAPELMALAAERLEMASGPGR
jgi:integrase/recombinase XerD